MTNNEKWPDRVYSRVLTRIEETLTELKQLQAQESQEATNEELEENLAQQVKLTEKLESSIKIALNTATIRHQKLLGAVKPDCAPNPNKRYTFHYSAKTPNEGNI